MQACHPFISWGKCFRNFRVPSDSSSIAFVCDPTVDGPLMSSRWIHVTRVGQKKVLHSVHCLCDFVLHTTRNIWSHSPTPTSHPCGALSTLWPFFVLGTILYSGLSPCETTGPMVDVVWFVWLEWLYWLCITMVAVRHSTQYQFAVRGTLYPGDPRGAFPGGPWGAARCHPWGRCQCLACVA